MTDVSNPHLLVIGALHIDEVAYAKAPIITGESNPVSWSRYAGGVAANLTRAAARDGTVSVALLANIGEDKDATDLAAALADSGVQVKPLPIAGTRTGRYSAIVQNNGDLLVGLADVEQAQAITLDMIRKHTDLHSVAAVVLDTNLSADALTDLSNYVRTSHSDCLIVALGVSPSKVHRLESSLNNLDILFCNELEADCLTNTNPSNRPSENKALLSQLSKTGCKHIVMTCGSRHVQVCSAKQHTSIAVPPVNTSQTLNGPGDALAGAVLSEVMQGALTHESLVQAVTLFGIPAAAKVVTGEHRAPTLSTNNQ